MIIQILKKLSMNPMVFQAFAQKWGVGIRGFAERVDPCAGDDGAARAVVGAGPYGGCYGGLRAID